MTHNDRDAIAPGTLTLPVRVFIIIATLLCCAILAKAIFTHKLSEAFLEQPNIPVAYGINPRDGMIAGYLSSVMQNVGHGEPAEKLAVNAITNTPLSARAVGTAALVEIDRNPSLGKRLLGYAANLGWRDERIQLRLARNAIAQGDVTAAAKHVDAAANFQGARGDVRTLIDDMTTSGPSLRAVARRLALGPIWRQEYLISPVEPIGSIAARFRVMNELISMNMPVSDLERSALILLSTKSEGLGHAYGAWLALYRPNLPHFVFDPHFAMTSDGSELAPPFIWRVSSPAGVATDTDSEKSRSALHVTTDGNAVGLVATQIVKIPPGRHALTISGRYGTPEAALGFRWTLICRNDTRLTGPVSPLSGSATGNAHFDFVIPSDGTCPFQHLALQAQSARQPGQIEAWFDDVRVD